MDLLRSFNRLPRASIDKHVRHELVRVLNSARDHTLFYGKRIGESISCSNVLDIIARVPISTKRDIQRSLKEMCVEGVEASPDATGGSTGEPTSFFTDMGRKKAGEAATYWSNSLAGYEYGDRVAMLWGAATRDSKPGMVTVEHSRSGFSIGVIRSGIRNWIENIRWYDAFDMGEDCMYEFHRWMTRFAPHLLVAYAGSIFEYARFLQKSGLEPGYPLKSIVSSAEVLTAEMRATVEQVFGKSVFDRYGNREFGPIAAECEAHNGLHVNERDMLVEIDSPDPYRIPGCIIVTYFRNHVMPFIRYNTGDRGVLLKGQCACGRKTIRLKTIEGRISDSILTRSGRLIHGEYFTHMLYGADGVREFQFVQETLDRYVLRVVADPCLVQSQERIWKQSIRERVGQGADVRVELVDEIPQTASGKRRFTLSLLTEVEKARISGGNSNE